MAEFQMNALDLLAKDEARTQRAAPMRKATPDIVSLATRYEASMWNLARSYLPAFIQSAREDINAMSRQEILRRTRYFEKNSGVFQKVLRCLEVNVIGSGITPTPAGRDTEWGKRALEWWNESFVPCADVTEQSDYYKLQAIGYRGQNIDGDGFRRHTFNASGRPAIDVVEAHRCGTGGVNIQDIEARGFKVVDGVIIDSFLRPLAYLIADEFDSSNVLTIPASQIVKLFNRKRAGQYRGISIMHAAIIDLHDLDDLQKYEMRAAKDAAAISRIIKGQAGGATVEGADFGSSFAPAQNTDPAARLAYYRQAIGGEVLVPQHGDEITQFESKRPSAATSGFWDKLDEKIVQGAGISYAALCDYRGNWGGATLRAVLQSDNRTYELDTIDQSRAAQRDWEFAIGWAIKSGELAANAEWNKVRWHPPRRTTVDVGNDSAAMIEELKAGVRTYEIIYGETGEDWRERLDQRAQEEAYIDELAKKYKIDRQLIASFAQERVMGAAADAAAGKPGSPAKGGGKEQNQ